MLTALLTIQRPRRWWHLRRSRRFTLRIPDVWEEVTPMARRQRWWRWIALLPPAAAQRAMLRDLVPRRIRQFLQPIDFAALSGQLDWTQVTAQCEQVQIPQFTHKGIVYVFPRPKGPNVSGVEFALADDYYKQMLEGDTEALFLLSACLWRERDKDEAAALRRGDYRMPLVSKEEAEARAIRLRTAPAEMHLQAVQWFAGMKLYVHRVYGKWIFEQDDDEDDESTGNQSTNHQPNKSPDFGWWGVFLTVAEAGVFGPLEKVHQMSIHDICIYLVKKRVEADAMPGSNSSSGSSTRQSDDDDE